MEERSMVRPFYWSVRRELWESRSTWIAPLVVAAVVLFASLVTTTTLPKKMRDLAHDPATQYAAAARPLKMAPAPIMLTTIIVGLFYCLDALHGERRDRSILFWKSLPVSDRTTVLSKAAIPFVVLPLLAYALSIVTQVFLLIVRSAVLTGSGTSPVPLWSEVRFFTGLLVMFYGLAVHALWLAPIYAWLLLVSAWARRAVLLWALVPAIAVGALEMIAFNTSRFLKLLQYRFSGAMHEAFAVELAPHGDIDRLSQLDPVRFFTRPGLWLGLAFAAACLAATVRLRRNREPI